MSLNTDKARSFPRGTKRDLLLRAAWERPSFVSVQSFPRGTKRDLLLRSGTG